MNAILRLYPRAWRKRYGDELAALLEERPASPLDQLDLIRGALDARLHPQVPGTDTSPEQAIPIHQRTLGLVAAIGGIAWILAVASIFILARNAYGDRDLSLAAIGLALATALIGVALGELGTRDGSAASTRTGHAVSIVSVLMGLTFPLPWPIFVIGFLGFPILSGLAVMRGNLNGALPGWFVAVYGIAALGSITGAMSDVGNSDVGPALLGLLGFGALILAWLAFSHRLIDRPEVSQA